MKQGMNRRAFMANSAMAGFFVAANKVYGQEATGEQKLRVLKIGAGGMGAADTNSLVNNGAIITGVCDVNPDVVKKVQEKFPGIPGFTDYRKLYDAVDPSSYDGVCVSTADHTHATIALDAMRRGKAVYVQKPLAHSFEECEMLKEAAEKYKVVTQMGNQGHPGVYRYEKLLENNFWGDILEVHSWTDRAGGKWWPQGMRELPKPAAIPNGYNWDCWLGPAKTREYSPAYTPFKWRGWCDFGCGAIGDMAVHNFDPAFWTLKLGLPKTIRAWCDQPAKLAWATYSTIDFHFGPTSVCPKGLNVYWYESGILPKRPLGSHPSLNVGTNGCMIIGSKATTLGGSHAGKPKCVAVAGERFGAATKEAEKACAELVKGDGKWSYNHYAEWVKAAKENKPENCGSKFAYASLLTEALLLGCISQYFPGETLNWDDEKKEFSGKPEATALLKGEKREGFAPRV